MQAVESLEGYSSKLKASEKELKRLERAAKKLAQQQADTDEERIYLEAKLEDHRRDAGALARQNGGLKVRYIQAVYEQDASAQRDVQNRRVEIDAELAEHEQAIQELSSSLETLPSFTEDAAAIAAQLDGIHFGDAFRFSKELETVLMSNQRALESRQSEARKTLPGFTQELYRKVRSEQDQDYARKLESDAKYQETQARIQRQREERRKLTKSEVRDQDSGYLLGWNILDENNKVIRFEKVKKVPIAST